MHFFFVTAQLSSLPSSFIVALLSRAWFLTLVRSPHRSPPFFLLFCEFALDCTSFARTRSYSSMVLTPAKRIMDFAGVPPNNAAPAGPMSFPNGTPPAPDMGSAPPPGSGPDSPKTTLW
ncbi:Uncharacterized protein HZ326_31341 [Fusarium oxysporum f. sp. albedinis]|nr:Uncharacterized protein HZ326_31341 [Fusarium oxysporum f. sp. albedinis]